MPIHRFRNIIKLVTTPAATVSFKFPKIEKWNATLQEKSIDVHGALCPHLTDNRLWTPSGLFSTSPLYFMHYIPLIIYMYMDNTYNAGARIHRGRFNWKLKV